jgi:hypothetical protein
VRLQRPLIRGQTAVEQIRGPDPHAVLARPAEMGDELVAVALD